MRPLLSTRIRSARRKTWSTSWETSSVVVPAAFSFIMSSSTWRVSITPSEAVGSSKTSNSGRVCIARTTASNCRCPADSECTRRSLSSLIPYEARMALVARKFLSSEVNHRPRSRPRNRLLATSKLSHKAASCHTTASPAEAAAAFERTRVPFRATSPPSGMMSPAMQRTSVDLPAPFSPTSATNPPVATSKSTPFKTRRSP